MSDASFSYRSRVSRPRKPRNIPFEAEQLLYRFTAGSGNPPKGQSDYHLSPHIWDAPPRTPLSTRENPQVRTLEATSFSVQSQSLSATSSLATSNAAHQASSPIETANASPRQLVVPNHSHPSSPSSSYSIRSHNRLGAPAKIQPANETPRNSPRDQLRKTATVTNANQITPINNINQRNHPGVSDSQRATLPNTPTSTQASRSPLDHEPHHQTKQPHHRSASALRTTRKSSDPPISTPHLRSISSEHQTSQNRLRGASVSRTPKPSDPLTATTRRRVVRRSGRESSPDYQSNESSRCASNSPAPRPQDSPPRRSSRARKDPPTYNVRALVGLELDQLDQIETVESGPGSGRDSRRSSPKPPHAPLITSAPAAPQAPQSLGSGSLRNRPNVETLIRDRQQGRLRSSAYYKQAFIDKLSDLSPWRNWKGASNDIVSLAWSPDGTRFAAGATTHGDDYNRGNNLVLGDLTRNSLRELPDHWKPRENPTSTQDPRLFTTVCQTQWVGERLYTASYDQTVKIWDIGKVPSCAQTIRHNAPVEVMAVSEDFPNHLATGTKEGFRLWNLDSLVSYQNLDLARTSGQKNVELSPTNLIWGNSAPTKNLIVGGMVQRTDDEADSHVARYGHLGMWKLEESSVTTIKLSPDSQNIFDIKWHPSMPIFATASSMRDPKSYPPGSKSLVNLYTCVSSTNRVIHSHSFACPAVDINEATFCPIGSNHVTASCTDGSTYVWDIRVPNILLHRLQHGDPIQPIDHQERREHADVGVRAAVWGNSIDQFYTGGSDGVIKQWDIRRATEDALVANKATFGEPVMNAAFSPDQAHLLVGDNGGGIHVLSSAPCADPEPRTFDFEYAPIQEESPQNEEEQDSEPAGVAAARELLASCQLTMNPLYGPVQGPKYSGPYARWPRNIGPNVSDKIVARTPLLKEHQLRQFQGPPVKYRAGLDEQAKLDLQRVFNLAHASNGLNVTDPQPKLTKRKRQSSWISLSSGDEDTRRPSPKKTKTPAMNTEHAVPILKPMEIEVIDLTSDNEEVPPRQTSGTTEVQLPPLPDEALFKRESPGPSLETTLHEIPDRESLESPDDISEGELDELPFYEIFEETQDDDHWWPANWQVDANIPRGTDV